MIVKELIEKLSKCDNQDAEVIIDFIDRRYSSFDFHTDSANPEFVYLVNDSYIGMLENNEEFVIPRYAEDVVKKLLETQAVYTDLVRLNHDVEVKELSLSAILFSALYHEIESLEESIKRETELLEYRRAKQNSKQ